MFYLLGIDIGTSGTKTALFNEKGALIASETAGYPLYQPENGWAEQKPEDWWIAVVTTITAVLQKSGINGEDISGIGLSGQMHGLVMLDADNNVLRPAIIWCDQRTAKECDELENIIGREKIISITSNPPLTGFTASKILWVRNKEPQIYDKCMHILLPKDYIRFMLTGEYATEVSDAGGMQLLDVPNRHWSDEILSKLKIDKSLLARVYESPDETGRISLSAARITGLKAGTPVAGGAGDNAAAAVGMGVVRDGRGFVTIGTSGVVYAHTSFLSRDPKGRIHTLCSAVPGEWHIMGVTQAAGLSLKWFKDNLCDKEICYAEKTGENVYALLDRKASEVPVGSNGLFFLPYLMGERSPHLDPHARGGFIGLSASHTKADMLRAVMEGVTFSLKDCLDIFEAAGVRVENMLACGGGGSSAFWRQMLADVFGCKIQSAISSEGAALGAAILGGVCSGIYGSVQSACDDICSASGSCTPDPENQIKYSHFYKLYASLYPALKNFYSECSKENLY